MVTKWMKVPNVTAEVDKSGTVCNNQSHLVAEALAEEHCVQTFKFRKIRNSIL
jgi:hypothetical protein